MAKVLCMNVHGSLQRGMRSPGIFMSFVRRRLACWVLVLFLGWGSFALIASANEIDNQADIKALYLYNLLLFVEWPKNTFSQADTLCVAVLGSEPLYHRLRSLSGNMIQSKRLMVRRWIEGEDIPTGCNVFYIAASNSKPASQILTKLKGKGILTVSAMEGFTEMSGMIQFKKISDQAAPKGKRFKINLTAVKREGLMIRARVLRLAEIVYE